VLIFLYKYVSSAVSRVKQLFSVETVLETVANNAAELVSCGYKKISSLSQVTLKLLFLSLFLICTTNRR
jgi:hypothetical protein